MKNLRVYGALALVCLLVPLSGCIGDAEDKPQVNVGKGGDEITKGLPPQTFSFEPVKMIPSGMVKKENLQSSSGTGSEADMVLCSLPGFDCVRDNWQISWNVTGLVDFTAPEGSQEELRYAAWVGKTDDTREDGVVWEKVPKSEGTGKDGTFGGKTSSEPRFRDYTAFLITIESDTDGIPGLKLLQYLDFTEDEPAPGGAPVEGDLEFVDPFEGTFADATVEELPNGGVNLSVEAFTLPETNANYDVFLKNDKATTFLGTMRYDEALAGYTFFTSPNPDLFTNYQFFISLEGKPTDEGDDRGGKAGGLKILKSKFAK